MTQQVLQCGFWLRGLYILACCISLHITGSDTFVLEEQNFWSFLTVLLPYEFQISLRSQKCVTVVTIFFPLLFSTAMEFHENLHNIGAREGLKERKLQKSVESFTWNITILKVMCLPLVSYCIFPFTTDILILLLVIILCHGSIWFFTCIIIFSLVYITWKHNRLSMRILLLFSCCRGLFHLVCLTISSYNFLTSTGSTVIWNTWVKQWVLISMKWLGLGGNDAAA